MAQSELGSRKRVRPPTPSYSNRHPISAGTLTRSKSQIYFWRNRSGHTRSDGSSFHFRHLQSLPKKPRQEQDALAQNPPSTDGCSCTSVIDLRTRRVFPDGENDIGNGNDSGKAIEKLKNEFSIESCSEGKSTADYAKKNQHEEDLNDKVDMEIDLLTEKQKNDDSVGGSTEDFVQATPPDMELFIGANEMGGNESRDMQFEIDSVGVYSEKQQNGDKQKNAQCLGEYFNGDSEKGKGRNSRTKPLLSPYSRVRVVKAPGSFSYRRLLPYLMDISRDNSCTSQIEKSSKVEEAQKVLHEESKTESCSTANKNTCSVSETHSNCNKEMSMSFSAPNDHCEVKSFSLASVSGADKYSQPHQNGGIKNYDTKISCQQQNLNGLDIGLCSSQGTSVWANAAATKMTCNEESEKQDIQDYSKSQNMQTLDSRVSFIMKKCHSLKGNEVGQYCEDIGQPKPEGLGKCDQGDSSEVRNPDQTNSNPFLKEDTVNLCSIEQIGEDDKEIQHQNDNSNEENVEMTPLDADIVDKPRVTEKGGNRTSLFLHLEKTCAGVIHTNFDSANNQLSNCCSKRKSVPPRRSPLKLFKTPGSISYRRMLPFLTEIAKDISCASGKGQHLKCESSEEEPRKFSNGSDCHVHLPNAIENDSSKDLEPNLSSCVDDFPGTPGSQHEGETHLEQNISKESNLETSHETIDTLCRNHNSFCPTLSFGSSPCENSISVSHEASVEECTVPWTKVTNGTKQVGRDSLPQDSSQLKASFGLYSPATDLGKGILKSTPRGCRGPCHCLQCSSFRLHAERAFEFSRNQMQDAEEMALHLVKELSYIRNMLEKSARIADGHAIVCINQVKEACMKASEAEEQAQNRIRQMNDDVNIHCRMTCAPRPRVTFANYVEVKTIPSLDSPNKNSNASRQETQEMRSAEPSK